MEKLIMIHGMTCQKCVAHVKHALEEIEGITSVEVGLSENTAKIKLEKDIANEILVEAIEDMGYDVKEII